MNRLPKECVLLNCAPAFTVTSLSSAFFLFRSNLAGTNQFACDCNVYNSIVAVIKALHWKRAAVCRTPSQVRGVRFFPGGPYEKIYRQRFLCSKIKNATHSLIAECLK